MKKRRPPPTEEFLPAAGSAMKLESLLKKIEIESVVGRSDVDVSCIACDSRHAKPGCLFVAIPGTRHNGWAFVEDGIARGAVAVVSEGGELFRRDVTHVRVKDARKALGLLADAFYGSPSARMRICGITGTNGKTTTAYLVRSMFEETGEKAGLIGTVEYRIGERAIPASRTTPDAVTLHSLLARMVAAGCSTSVMEVSSHGLAQNRVAGIEFDVAVLTNITRDHLDYHGTLEAYFEAKSILFRTLGLGAKKAVAVLNADDPAGERLRRMVGPGVATLSYGLSGTADVRAEDVRVLPDGTCARIVTPWGKAEVKLRLIGRFNVSNVLAAVAAAGSQGIGLDRMLRSAAAFAGAPGRLEEIPTDMGFRVFVDYAHTDDALERVLSALREICSGRLIVTFGCGGNRDRTKRPAMGAVASRMADLAVITSDNPRSEDPEAIIAEILRGCSGAANVEVRPDRGDAIKRCLEAAEAGDVVLVAGKGHEGFQELADRTVPFDDRVEIRKMLSCRS